MALAYFGIELAALTLEFRQELERKVGVLPPASSVATLPECQQRQILETPLR